ALARHEEGHENSQIYASHRDRVLPSRSPSNRRGEAACGRPDVDVKFSQRPISSRIQTPPCPGPALVKNRRPDSKPSPSATHSAACAASSATGSGGNEKGERDRYTNVASQAVG